MSFFTKQEIMQRMQELKSDGSARADVNLALIILGSALFEKRLKSGEDYGGHPLHVGLNNTRSIPKKIIGILHDVVEDSDWTVEDLRSVGFSERIVAGVDAMTHREGEKYFDSIERCGLNSDGRDKKIEDLSHNLDASRLEQFMTEKDVERSNKYKIARAYLVAIKKNDIPPGASIVDFARNHATFKNSDETQRLLQSYSSRSEAAAKVTKGAKQAFGG